MSFDAKPASPERATALAYLFLTCTSLCWGMNAVFGRLAVGEVSPMMIVSLRWFVTLAILALFARSALRQALAALQGRWLYFGAMGAIGFTAFNALYYVAAHSTTAVNIGIIQGAMPVFVFIGAFVAYRTRVTALQIAGALITMAGVAVVASGGSLARLASFGFAFGDVLMVVAGLLYAGYTVALRRRPQIPALAMFAALAAAAFVASLPLLAVEAAIGNLQWPTPSGWIIVVLVAVFPSVIAQTCFIKGVELIGPGRAGVFINLVPVFASILGVAVLSESFHLYHAAALCLVLGGIALSERGKAKNGDG